MTFPSDNNLNFGEGMLPYYLFAFFIFILICLVLVLWRVLFAGLKREQLQLDRKEEELKELLRNLRKEADDFFDLAAEKAAEISEERKRISALVAGFALSRGSGSTPETAPQPTFTEFQPAKPSQYREIQKAAEETALKEALKKAEAKETANKEAAAKDSKEAVAVPIDITKLEDYKKTAPAQQDAAEKKPEVKGETKFSKRELIINLLDSGKDAVQVAKELGLTRNEVDLVIKTR